MKNTILSAAAIVCAVICCLCAWRGMDEPASERAEQAPVICEIVFEEAQALPPIQARTEERPEEVVVQVPGVHDADTADIRHYTDDEAVMVAKVLHRECGSLPSATEQACVAWTICNRVDSDEFPGDTITDIVTARYQFAYDRNAPVTDELYALALDVLERWSAEKNGAEEVGRVIPNDYTYFTGDGTHNYFRNAYQYGYSVWDYSLPSPYES